MSCTRWLTQGRSQNAVTSSASAAALTTATAATIVHRPAALSFAGGVLMRLVSPVAVLVLVLVPVLAGSSPVRPVSTYSIVARDATTGELGVAVQSHWFSVGPIVPWAESGVGEIATQSFAEPSYGPLGLAMMRVGKTAPEALAALLAGDAQREV